MINIFTSPSLYATHYAEPPDMNECLSLDLIPGGLLDDDQEEQDAHGEVRSDDVPDEFEQSTPNPPPKRIRNKCLKLISAGGLNDVRTIFDSEFGMLRVSRGD
jgi:hypothetical protein